LDLGGNADRDLSYLGAPAIALDPSWTVLGACRRQAPGSLPVRAHVEHLPLAGRSVGGAWSFTGHLDVPHHRLPLALWDLHRALSIGAPIELRFRARHRNGERVAGETGQFSAGLSAPGLMDRVVGAGFEVEKGDLVVSGDELLVRAVRGRTLADTVSDGMRILVCGVNASFYSADAGIGYARPGNRFWPAALAADLVDRDRDPRAALVARGMGMTDFVKRPTRTAAEVTVDEYRHGYARLERLVEWLLPGAVCFVGLSGWRAAVNPKAVAGIQPERVGGRPAYVMPSTSGLNARTSLGDLTEHLVAAAELSDSAEGVCAATDAPVDQAPEIP
jgi:TDG/mug DNA glycosylase family protein